MKNVFEEINKINNEINNNHYVELSKVFNTLLSNHDKGYITCEWVVDEGFLFKNEKLNDIMLSTSSYDDFTSIDIENILSDVCRYFGEVWDIIKNENISIDQLNLDMEFINNNIDPVSNKNSFHEDETISTPSSLSERLKLQFEINQNIQYFDSKRLSNAIIKNYLENNFFVNNLFKDYVEFLKTNLGDEFWDVSLYEEYSEGFYLVLKDRKNIVKDLENLLNLDTSIDFVSVVGKKIKNYLVSYFYMKLLLINHGSI